LPILFSQSCPQGQDAISGEVGLTAADMNRLEHAARLSMGGIPDGGRPIKDLRRIRYLRLLIVFAAVAPLVAALKFI
jgi:hypothetical protein